jgi:hypothetical protein
MMEAIDAICERQVAISRRNNMSTLMKDSFVTNCMKEGSQAAMERALIEAYLKGRGYSLKMLQKLPPEEVKILMTEACEYAALRLAQVESTARFRDKIHGAA